MGLPRAAVVLVPIIGIAAFAWLSRPQESVRAADAPPSPAAATADSEEVYQKTIVPLLVQNCYQCHGNGNSKGDIALDSYKTVADVEKHRDDWEDIRKQVHSAEMPPPTARNHPSLSERNAITDWIEHELYKYDPAHPDPGRVTIHRLNRAEYNNTIRDLVGVNFQPAEDFPSDDSGYGFDNIGDVLSLPPVLMEKYLAAANRIMDDAIVTQPIRSQTRHYLANLMEMGFNADGDRGDGWMPLGGLEEDAVAETIPVPAGDYVIRVYAFVQTRGGPPADDVVIGGRQGGQGRGRNGRGGGRGAATQQAGGAATQQAAGAATQQAARGAGRAAAAPPTDLNTDNTVNNVNANDGGAASDNANADAPAPRGRGRGFANNAAADGAGAPANVPAPQIALATASNGAPTTQSAIAALSGPPTTQSALSAMSTGSATRPTAAPATPPTPQGLKMAIMIDGAVATDLTVTAAEAKPAVYEYRVGVTSGTHRFAVANRRIRGGANELLMTNGRLGKQQSGTIWVKWVEIEGPLPGSTIRFSADTLATAGEVGAPAGAFRKLDHDGQVTARFTVPKAGDYVLRAQAYADQAGNEPTRMEWRINGKAIQTFDVTAPGDRVPVQGQRIFSMELLKSMPYIYELHTTLEAGPQEFTAAFINDFSDPKAIDPNLHKRNLYISYLEVVNPNEPQPLPPMPAALAKNFTVKPTPETKPAVAREILTNFTRRAWRRPAQSDEIDGLMRLFDMADKNGETFDSAIKLPMKAVLVSPYFLFRGEIQPDPNDPKSVHPISDYELASRLSYFLWSSMPDDELLNLAGNGQLRANLTAQVQRMLTSPKAQALVENFSGQWLQTRNLNFVAPDKTLFPDYDNSLRDAMRTETQLFFNAVMREDRSVMDFINGDFTFVNQRLADFYGMQGVKGDQFQRVSLDGLPRRGVLTQGSVLVITSNPTRTSPVKRGKWVLENLLGTPPPEPPPDVPPLPNDGHPATGTLRQQMEQHRANPACASCHAQMDPLGFGLENFDGVGKWRDKDGNDNVDPSGQLATGETFAGAVELENILATTRQDEFLDCLAEKILTYAMGRGVEPYDRPAVEQIVAGMKKNDLKFSSMIMEVAKSLPFEEIRGESDVALVP